mmetsp:Transcript_93423/g.146975  ORF Transcript_93423/g.146975 Transcript_93423/m.146975 type:complete len:718 (-) Transcript_93423:424-2577(-)
MSDQSIPWATVRGESPFPPLDPPIPLDVSSETLREELRVFAQGALRHELAETKASICSDLRGDIKEILSDLVVTKAPLFEEKKTLESEELGDSVEENGRKTTIPPSALMAGVPADNFNFNMKGYFAMTELKEGVRDGDTQTLQTPTEENKSKKVPKAGHTPLSSDERKVFPVCADQEKEAPPGALLDNRDAMDLQNLTPIVTSEPESAAAQNFTPRKTEDAVALQPTPLNRKTTPASREHMSTARNLDVQGGISGLSRLPHADQGRLPRARLMAQKLVHSAWFDYLTGFLILTNAVQIGVQTDYAARHRGQDPPGYFRVLEIWFCVLFTTELGIRLVSESKRFFTMKGWRWNVFDVVVVGLQLLEEFLALLAHLAEDKEDEVLFMNLSFLRVLRVMRLVRIIRLVRILRLITELRTLIMSIICSMRSLIWTMVLMFIMIYIFSVYFTQLVADYVGDLPQDLARYYGTLDITILTLYESITGGLDWRDAVDPLIKWISAWMAVFFSCYIAFSVLAVMNVVTGVFVESALLSAKGEQDIFMINNLRDLFEMVTLDKGEDCHPTDLVMTWEDFVTRLHSVQMQDYFKAIDVDPSDARGIFCLLDQDNTGFVTFEDFVNGCCRLRGQAKALDLQILLHELRRFSSKMEAHTQYVEGGLHFKKLARYLPKSVADHGYQSEIRIERLSNRPSETERTSDGRPSRDIKEATRDSLASAISVATQ